MGALKGRFQCLRGLRVKINNHESHREAMRWISVAIILHNLIIEINGTEGTRREWEDYNTEGSGQGNENDGGSGEGDDDDGDDDDDNPAVSKRNQLIAELLWAKYCERL